MEALVAQVNSLQHKLGGNNDSKEFISFLIQLMRGKEVNVPGGFRGDIATRITTMFRDAQRVREFSSVTQTRTLVLVCRDEKEYKTFRSCFRPLT